MFRQHMRTVELWLACLAWGVVQSAQATPTNDLVAAVSLYQEAHRAWQPDLFADAVKLLNRVKPSSREERSALHYWFGVIEFHRMLCLRSGDSPGNQSDEATSAAAAAVDNLRQLLSLEPDHAEAHALLATLYGIQIQESPLRALRLGRALLRHLDAARTAGDNPRVHYLLGMARLRRAQSAADLTAARDTLLSAHQLFVREAQSPPRPLEPRWGHPDCLAFLAEAEEKLGNLGAATDACREALRLHTNHNVARLILSRIATTQ